MQIAVITREEWLARYENHNTQNQARIALVKFDKFLKEKYTGETEQKIFTFLKESEDVERYFFLDQMVQYFKQSLGPTATKTYFVFIRSWLKFNRIKTDEDDIKSYIKFPKQPREKRKPISRDIIRTLLDECEAFYRTLFLVQCASGMRISEILNMVPSWINHALNPVMILIPAWATKTQEDRKTFLTPEAWSALQPFLKDRKPNDIIFDTTIGAAEMYMKRVRERCNLNERYQSSRNHHITTHRFRSFAETQLSNVVGSEFAHTILGHRGYMMQYYGTPDEEMAQMYAKAIPQLTISDTQRYKDKAHSLEEKLQAQSVDSEKLGVIAKFLTRNPEFAKEFEKFAKS